MSANQLESSCTTVADITTPLAIVHGEALLTYPADLYIPPDAMQVLLANFNGPFDLLLYLIKKNNFDILDIPVVEVTRQYLEYLHLMQHLKIELAAEYLVMAAILAEIKSHLLLPPPVPALDAEHAQESDPRIILMQRLQVYEQFKTIAEQLDRLPRLNRDCFIVMVDTTAQPAKPPYPLVTLADLVQAMMKVNEHARLHQRHRIPLDTISLAGKISFLLQSITHTRTDLIQLCCPTEGRLGIVVSFLALLELLKQNRLACYQHAPFTPIYIQQTISKEQDISK